MKQGSQLELAKLSRLFNKCYSRNLKYDKLVEKGTYINSKEAMISFNEGTQVTTYDYITVPFSSIDDSLVNISSKDIKKYYNENKEKTINKI